MDILSEMKDIIYKTIGNKEITEDTDFIKDLKLNSFDIVNITAVAEERFKVMVPSRDLWKIHTVRDFMDYMNSKGFK